MGATNKAVAWILGSGFSRSLGGPLLSELLSQQSRVRLARQYKDVKWLGGRPDPNDPRTRWNDAVDFFDSESVQVVYDLFAFGTGYPEGWIQSYDRRPSGLGAKLWAHAEEFLDYLDAETNGGSDAFTLPSLLTTLGKDLAQFHPQDYPLFSHAARRIIAAECAYFLEHRPTTLEVWQPYVDWAAQLEHTDTVVSFNYDTVVETAALAAARREAEDERGKGIHVYMQDEAALRKAVVGNMPVLVKLHGSIDWKHVPNKTPFPFERVEGKNCALLAGPREKVAIATPGPTKKAMTDDDFAPLWQYAAARIREADAVVFLGYRFPPSDAQARGRILGAITENTRPEDEIMRHTLDLHVVLGDDHPAAERLEALLKSLRVTGGNRARSRNVQRRPLFVEDFLTVCHRRNL